MAEFGSKMPETKPLNVLYTTRQLYPFLPVCCVTMCPNKGMTARVWHTHRWWCMLLLSGAVQKVKKKKKLHWKFTLRKHPMSKVGIKFNLCQYCVSQLWSSTKYSTGVSIYWHYQEEGLEEEEDSNSNDDDVITESIWCSAAAGHDGVGEHCSISQQTAHHRWL